MQQDRNCRCNNEDNNNRKWTKKDAGGIKEYPQ